MDTFTYEKMYQADLVQIYPQIGLVIVDPNDRGDRWDKILSQYDIEYTTQEKMERKWTGNFPFEDVEDQKTKDPGWIWQSESVLGVYGIRGDRQADKVERLYVMALEKAIREVKNDLGIGHRTDPLFRPETMQKKTQGVGWDYKPAMKGYGLTYNILVPMRQLIRRGLSIKVLYPRNTFKAVCVLDLLSGSDDHQEQMELL
jgi:hypothetical protein